MARKIRKWIGVVLLVLFALAALTAGAAYVWFRYTVARSQPEIDGRTVIAELQDEVEMIRDSYGVPHIYARNSWDLYLAMGYAMAQDRLWQMEFYRRLGSGRLSEIFGRDTLEIDRLFRTLALSQRRSAIPPEVEFIPRAFAAGINAYLQHREHLPLEFVLLDFRPEPWTAADYLDVLRVVQWGLSLGWKVDRTAARILAAVGEERFQEAFPDPSGIPPIIPPDEAALWKQLPAFPDEIAARRIPLSGFRPTPASNNWAVAADRSQSGFPLLATDTHMALSNPSVWWEVHLVCPPDIDAAGFAIPGLPGLPVGHNRRTAWGVTNVMLDDVDFRIQQLHPTDPLQYRVENRWFEMRTVDTTIDVRNADPLLLQVKLTDQGPLLHEFESNGEPRALAVRWSALELSPPADAAHRLLKAGSVAEIVSALRSWDTPGQNFVFADTAGSIGYWCCAAIPIRKNTGGMLPVNGWQADNLWQGYVKFEQRPHRIDPAAGYIATANNPVFGRPRQPPMGNYWESADRIVRIRDCIESVDLHSVDTLRQIQADVSAPLAADLVPQVLAAVPSQFAEEWLNESRDVLQRWDHRMQAGSSGALIFESTYLKLLEILFRGAMGPDLYRQYLDTVVFPPRALRGILRRGASAWLTDAGSSEPQMLAEAAAEAFRRAATDLRDRFGDDPDSWRWGQAHRLTFSHVLAERKPLDRVFNLGPFPVAGNGLTINKKSYPYPAPFRVTEGASQRMIVDLADPLAARHVLPTGESGLLGSPHYRDQVELYLAGTDRPMHMERSAVEAGARGRLVLSPP